MIYGDKRNDRHFSREKVVALLTDMGIDTNVDFLKRLETQGVGDQFEQKLKIIRGLATIYQVPVSMLLFGENSEKIDTNKVVQLQKEIQKLQAAIDNFNEALKILTF